ncbi:hypothetical protein LCGC14_2744540, partial [marine sediment metagenome]
MGKSEEELLGLPPLPVGYKLVGSQVPKIPETSTGLPPLPEGFQFVPPKEFKLAPGLEEQLAQPIPDYKEERLIETPLPGQEQPAPPMYRPEWAEIGEETLKGAAEDALGGIQEVFEGATNVLGMVEAPYSIATGLLAFIPSLATNYVAQLHPDISYAEAEQLGHKVAEAIAYIPKTEIGQIGAQTLGKPFAMITEGLDVAAEAVAPGDPNSQAVFRTLAWTAVIAAAPTLKSGLKQSLASLKAKGKPVPPEALKAIVEQEITKVAKTTFKMGEKPAGEGIIERGAPREKTNVELGLEKIAQRGVEKKKAIVRKTYPDWYIEQQDKILAEKQKLPTFEEFDEAVFGKPKEAPKAKKPVPKEGPDESRIMGFEPPPT